MPEAVKKSTVVQKSYELLPQNDRKDASIVITKQPGENKSQSPVFDGYEEVKVTCHKCRNEVISVTRLHITDKTHLYVFGLSLVFWLAAFLFIYYLSWPIFLPFLAGIPYCLKWCQTVEHICPNCNASLGKYSRF